MRIKTADVRLSVFIQRLVPDAQWGQDRPIKLPPRHSSQKNNFKRQVGLSSTDGCSPGGGSDSDPSAALPVGSGSYYSEHPADV